MASFVATLPTRQSRVLLATEMGARGLDMPHVTHVLNFEPPSSAVDYLHRAGRAGRFGRPGAVVTLVADEHEERRVMAFAASLGLSPVLAAFEGGVLKPVGEAAAAAAGAGTAVAATDAAAGSGAGTTSAAGGADASGVSGASTLLAGADRTVLAAAGAAATSAAVPA